MFTPLNLMADSLTIGARRVRFRDRWKTDDGVVLAHQIEDAIINGEGDRITEIIRGAKDGFFDSLSDMRGFHLVSKTIDAHDRKVLDNITISYARLRDLRINKGVLLAVRGNYLDATRVVFEQTTFIGTSYFGATFEDCTFVDCNFLERNAFVNCSFKNVQFKNCFFEIDVFTDCMFDELTSVNHVINKSHDFDHAQHPVVSYHNQYMAAHYHSLREAYEAGRISHKEREYTFKEKQSLTRYNTDSRSQQLGRYFLEYATGYGVKPLRVLVTAVFLLTIFTSFFLITFGERGFLLSTGAFLTFGANTGMLENTKEIYQIIYAFEAFLGITTMSTFIAVMINYWASLR